MPFLHRAATELQLGAILVPARRVGSSTRSTLRHAQPGDILLFRHANGFSRLIPLLSGSPFHHVALYEGKGWVIESRVTGVSRRNVYQAKVRLRFRVIPAPGGPDVGRRALAWASTKLGEPYAFGSIFALVVNRLVERFYGHTDIVWRQSDRASCGELVAQAFEAVGHPLFSDLEPEEVAPWDFVRLLHTPSAER